MAPGYHMFYANVEGSRRQASNDRTTYFLGGFKGDHFADDHFKQKMDRIQRILTRCYGISGYSYHWVPLNIKPYKPRTKQQRYDTAVKKAAKKHSQKIDEIRRSATLFADHFIREEEDRLSVRTALLKERYGIRAIG